MKKKKSKKKKRKEERKRRGIKKRKRGEERRNGGVTYPEPVDKLYYKSVNSLARDNECSGIGLLLVKLKKHDGLVTDYTSFIYV